MNSTCTPDFWEQYNALSKDVRELADRVYEVWSDNPRHPSCHFKPVKGTPDWWSVRIGLYHRALCVRDGGSCNWFFIGTHRDYDSLVP